MESAQQVPQREPGLGVESDGRLVEKDHLRLMEQRAGDHQPLLLAARQVLDLRGGLAQDLELLQQGHRPCRRDAGGHAVVGAVKDEVLDDVEPAIGIRPLRHHANAATHGHILRAHIVAGHERLAARRVDPRGEDAERGRLPRPVRPKQAEELAVVDAEIEPVEGRLTR